MKKLVLCLLSLALLTKFANANGAVRGLDHVAVVVPKLSAAKTFFSDGLGCESVFDLGPFKDDKGNWMAAYIGTHPRAKMTIAIVKCGNASTIELMEIESPSQNARMPKRDDIGSASLGFYTDDLEASIARIEKAGGTALGGITDVTSGPEKGRRFIYTLSPWGQIIFLLNDGDGIAYKKQSGNIELFSPADLPSK